MSRMLPGIPLWPYGNFSGSTSTVLPLGRNVTLNFLVAFLYFTSSIYGLLPPIDFSLNFRQFLAFQRRLHRGIHQQFRKVFGGMIQLINLFPDQFVIGAL